MKKEITILITFSLALSLCGCGTYYTTEDINRIYNEAYEAGEKNGYDIGFDDGREYAEDEIDLESFRDHLIYDSGLREAQRYVEDSFRIVEDICAADDYIEDENMEQLLGLLDEARGYLNTVEGEIYSYEP